jgi:regulator of sirC expression with transglutaminase-like and TPR domain
MSPNQQKALVDLLEDGDSATVELVKRELIEGGATRLAEYHQLLDDSACGEIAHQHLQEVIAKVERSLALGNISRGLASLESLDQLEALCWELGRSEHPGLDTGPYSRQLDSWAEALRAYLARGATVQEQVRVLVRFLAYEQRLTGNHHDYYHPRNCYLPWVIEFRQGLPLTLTMVYILVGRRAGLHVEGISAPGHFVARLGDVYFDPYYSGRLISEGEWERITAEVSESQRSHLMHPCSPAQMAHRLLINLRNAYIKRGDGDRQRQIDHYLAVLQH